VGLLIHMGEVSVGGSLPSVAIDLLATWPYS
jgi:hypothetical protein